MSGVPSAEPDHPSPDSGQDGIRSTRLLFLHIFHSSSAVPPIPVYTYNTYFHSPLHVHTNSVDFHIIIDTVNPYTNGTEESIHICDFHKISRPKPVLLLPAAVGLSRNYCIPLFPYPQVPMSAVS